MGSICAAVALFISALALYARAQIQVQAQITIEGTVRSASGEPVPQARVTLRRENEANFFEATTDARGVFGFKAEPGTYTIAAEKAGWSEGKAQSITATQTGKHIDLVLSPLSLNSANMEFSDQPSFSIAGITDWSGAGGHGSETGLRTTEALTRKTLALDASTEDAGKPLTVEEATRLRRQREQIQKTLARENRSDLHRQLGDIDERLNDPLAAQHEYEEATRLDPTEANYFTWGAELLLHRASQAAADIFGKGVHAHPQSARLRAGIGAALYASGSIEQAAQHICEASNLEPNRAEFYALMADIEKTATSTPSCIAPSLARFATLQPSNASANYYYAVSLWKRRRESRASMDADQAEKLLEKAISLDSHFGEAYLQLGIMRAERGQAEQAIGDFQSCVSVSPKLAECHYRLGLAYGRLGQEDKAKREIQKYQQVQAAEIAEIERQRNNLRQFLVVLKDQTSSVH